MFKMSGLFVTRCHPEFISGSRNKFGMTRNARGQTLIETVIALAVVLILVSALISVSIASVRSAMLSKNKTTAAQLAYSESELVRQVRDAKYSFIWTLFTGSYNTNNCLTTTTSPSFCHVDEATLDFVSGAKTNSIFTISLTNPASNPPSTSQLTYTVSVTWNDSLGAHTETVSSILTPWK